MCGIIGYIGSEKIETVLMKGLSRLEYRGYDSAGLASVHEGRLQIVKDAGKLANLYESIRKTPVQGGVGIGHTRWATHGEPSGRNAHPHTDCTQTIAVVHNGIIENYEELTERLTREGHKFNSDTDTEVLCHLLENYHIRQGKTLEEAMRLAMGELEGSYAICAISAREGDKMVAVRNGSPLAVGVAKGHHLVASDAPAILDYTRDVIFLEDYQMVTVTGERVKVTDRAGLKVDARVTQIDWDVNDVSKEGYPHFMLKEIEEQPKVLERMIRTRLRADLSETLFDTVRIDPAELSNVERVLIQCCGTSWHAALTAKFLFENIAGIPTEVDVSSEFRYRYLIPQRDTLVLSITQSGETVDTLMGMRHAKQRGFKTLSICNVLGSTIARESDAVIYTHAGPEIGVASTKAYTAQLGVLILLAFFWARHNRYFDLLPCGSGTNACGREVQTAAHSANPQAPCGLSGNLTIEDLLTEFSKLPERMRTVIESKEQIREIAKKYYQATDFLFLGRGVNYPNAHEGALKIKEIAYIHATGHPAGEMKHGPIALIDEHMPVVCIAPKSSVYEKMASNMQEVKARRGKVIAIATAGDTHVNKFADDLIYLPAAHEFLTPVLVAIPLQYLAYFVAVLRGTDVDQPRNLAKSVTVE